MNISQKHGALILFCLLTIVIFGHSELPAALDTAWTKTYGTAGEEKAYDIKETADSGFIIAGYSGNFDIDSDVLLIRTDSEGNVIWYKTYSRDYAQHGYSVQITPDGGYIVAGSKTSSIPDHSVAYLIKTDQNGDTAWTHGYGWNMWTRGYSIICTDDGGYFLTGYTAPAPDTYDSIHFLKLNSFGDPDWAGTHGFPSYINHAGMCALQASDGNYIICGWSGDAPYDPYNYYPVLLKLNTEGDTLWSKRYTSYGAANARSVVPSFDGGYVLGLAAEFEGGMINVDADGEVVWTNPIFGSFYDISTTDQPGYILCGYYDPGVYNLMVALTDIDGNVIWSETYGEAGNLDIACACQQTSDGGYIVVGFTETYGAGGYDVYLLKFEDIPEFTRGDANGDQTINVSDAVHIINYVFVGGDPPDPLEAGDCNCDETCNVSDAVWIINYVFVGGNVPGDTDGDGQPDC